MKKCKNKNLLLNEIKELKNTVNNLRKCIIHKQIVNNIQNIQQQNIQNNNVQINPFGQENLSYITPQFLQRCVKKPVTGIIKLIENIHFHKDHPENHNVFINNFKGGYIQIHNGEKWIIQPKDDIIVNLIEKKTEIMDNFYDDNERLFTDSQGGRYLRFQTKIEDENPKIIKTVSQDVELLLYNNRDIIDFQKIKY